MGIFSSLFKKEDPNPIPYQMRELMFGDAPLNLWPADEGNKQAEPWNKFIIARNCLSAGDKTGAIAAWRQILEMPGLESRQYLQAWNFLRAQGEVPPAEIAKQVLGFVIEVSMPKGLDILGAYADHSARYWNFSGAGVVWEHPDTSLDALINSLLAASKLIVEQIGPWEHKRLPAPTHDQVRISFLTPSGLHFGQGSMNELCKEPMAKVVIQLSTGLMLKLTGMAKKG